jgi:hypothetical protein
MTHRTATLAACTLLVSGFLRADEPAPLSGLKLGQRPMPYSFVLATGPQRGTSFCYICDTADKPAAVVFARTLTEPLGRLAAKLDQAVADAAVPEFRAWLTVLDDGKDPGLESKVVAWGRKHALRHVPLGMFEDAVGPPAYRLHRAADVTVVLFARQKTVANFAFKAGELTDEKIGDVAAALEKLK